MKNREKSILGHGLTRVNTDQIHLGGAFAAAVSGYRLSSADEVIMMLAARVRARQPVPGNSDQRAALTPSVR
jgi:RNA:NAD 2'-phosphotransferase (TPT1/KptA family)